MQDPSAAPLSGDELATWSALATVLEWLPSTLDAHLLADSGITHFEYGVLFALASAPERALRMSVLAGYANSSLTRLSRAASRLEARGWLRRSTDPVDGRFTLALLTDEGFERCAQAEPGHTDTVRRIVLDPLTPAQTRQLREISLSIQHAIRADESWRPPAG